jgi:hypothetical protein
MISIRRAFSLAAVSLVTMATAPNSTVSRHAAPPNAVATPNAAALPKPSRAAQEDCRWERFNDRGVGLAAWVQRCDFGSRKIDFVARQRSLAVRFSDGGAPDPVVDVYDLQPGEDMQAGMRRVFAAHADASVAGRCVIAPFRGEQPKRIGAERYSFVPDAKYGKELDAARDPNEIGEPACGELGDMDDGIQYFEVQPSSGARRFLFVRVGQDTPLFDEQTLQILPASSH